VADSEFKQVIAMISAEIGRLLSQVDAREASRLVDALAASQGVFVTGEGRSGLIARAFATRLMHLGLPVHVVGEAVTPAAGAGDLLIAVSGSGATLVACAHAQAARALGMQVAAVTASPGSPLVALSDLQLLISGPSEQYGGSLFEQAALAALDALALLLQRRLGQTAADLEARHANL